MHCCIRGASDVGKIRDGNEDFYLVDDDLHLALVADGMGGHACGEVASKLAADTFFEVLVEHVEFLERASNPAEKVRPREVEDVMRGAMQEACRRVYDAAQLDEDKHGMGTTCTALVHVGDRACVAHVGDSRAYLVRDGEAIQLTRDHSLLNHLIDQGRVSVSEVSNRTLAGYRNALARAIGVTRDIEVDTFSIDVLPGDVFVLGSDGLTHYLKDDSLTTMAGDADGALAERLVALANDGGGHDNITAVTVHLESTEAEQKRHEFRAGELRAKVEAFRNIPMFANLDYGQLLHVLSLARSGAVESGRQIILEGDLGEALFVVLSGSVRVSKNGTDVAVLGPGEHFGELALLDEGPRSATVETIAPTRIMRLRRSDLLGIMNRTPQLGMRLLWAIAGVVARRLRDATATAVQVVSRDAVGATS